MPEKLKFLTAPRFWAMVLFIAAAVLHGDISMVEAVQYFSAGFLGIGTIDRVADKLSISKTYNLLEAEKQIKK